jgi:hypothetical protein
MKPILSLAIIILIWKLSYADSEITYIKHIQPIINIHCAKCHDDKGSNPFSLLSYEAISKKADYILHVIESGIMPPWPANPAYRSFLNENIVSKNEISTIRKWIAQGKVLGESIQKDEEKTHSITDTSKKEILTISKKINIRAREKDYFMRFHIHDSINNDIYVSRFEFTPGNKKIVHHSEVFIDTTNSLQIDYSDIKSWQIPGLTYELKEESLYHYNYLTGWLPGEKHEEFPIGIAARIPSGSNFLFLLHYAPSLSDESDSSSLIMYLSNEENIREYSTFGLHGHSDLTEGKFFIPANKKVTLHASKTIEEDITAFAVLPHAHHLARNVKAFAITPQKLTIPLLQIDDWDFNWQFLYKFREFVKLPSGTVVHFFVEYDNTSENPENPHNPPADIHYAFDADQEMMEFFIYYVPYKKNDELKKIIYPSDSY